MKKSINVGELKHHYKNSFWKRVKIGDTTEDCWEHQNKSYNEYGHVQLKLRYLTGNKNPHYKAHVISWILENGKDVPQDKYVLHSCNNPRCVNPNHLYLGTHQDNMRDKSDHIGHGVQKALDILKWCETHPLDSHKEVSKIFNCSRQHVDDIVNNKPRYLRVSNGEDQN